MCKKGHQSSQKPKNISQALLPTNLDLGCSFASTNNSRRQLLETTESIINAGTNTNSNINMSSNRNFNILQLHTHLQAHLHRHCAPGFTHTDTRTQKKRIPRGLYHLLLLPLPPPLSAWPAEVTEGALKVQTAALLLQNERARLAPPSPMRRRTKGGKVVRRTLKQ